MTSITEEVFPTEDDAIVRQAKERFERCEKWESNSRKAFLEDVKFANADSDNGYQWPDKLRQNRDVDQRPNLTINRVRQHNLQIINEARQNKPSIKFRPTSGDATFKAAEVLNGIIQHIEYISRAQAAYDRAVKFQVDGGVGYLRIVTDYADNDSFDQEIFIRSIRDPLTVYLDPDAQDPDKADARYGFIFDDMSLDEFKLAYPKYEHLASQAPLGKGDGWMDKDHVRVCEYFRLVEKKDKLVALPGEDGMLKTWRKSAIGSKVHAVIIDDPAYESRSITYDECEWYLIAGNEIIDHRIWPGRYIPIVQVVGEEVIINGELDRKGHTRNLKDAQRMLNYWSSSAVEQVALQGKTPWVAAVQAIEGYETYWSTANTTNHSVLPYNAMDDAGNPIPPPQRASPPELAQAYITGLQMSREQMMEASGQYQANFGQQSNERSGKAINERQRQGDTATYHFIDNFATALRYAGTIILDLIPHIYDTDRVIKILAEDGAATEITIAPTAPTAYSKKRRGEIEEVLFNPNVGKYAVETDVGPNYATKRQEAFNAFSQIITQAPQTLNLIGDLLFKNADFPGADKIAERLERLVPPEAKGEGASQAEVALKQQLDQTQAMLQSALDQLAEEKLKFKSRDEKRQVDIYDAITRRMGVVIKEMINPRQIAQLTYDMMRDEQAATLQPAINATTEDINQTVGNSQ